MKSYENDDELDRALFALPLEEPPADLRASILASTVYRQPVSVKAWELWAIGALLALVTWLLIDIATGGAGSTLAAAEGYANRALELVANPQVLIWTGIGGAAALWFSQLNLTVAPKALRATRR